MNFQYAATAIAAVHLLHGTPLRWTSVPGKDIPIAISVETGGPGDDIMIETNAGTIEIQAKKGLRADDKLWKSIVALGKAAAAGKIIYGTVVVATDAGRDLRTQLPLEIKRLAEGREDGSSKLGTVYKSKIEEAGLALSIGKKLQVQTLSATQTDGEAIKAAIETLRIICAQEHRAEEAWDLLLKEAGELVARRGRWEAADMVRLLADRGIEMRDADFPGAIIARVARWAAGNNARFAVPAARTELPMEQWLELDVVARPASIPADTPLAEALDRYHRRPSRPGHDEAKFVSEAEWIGRFYRLAVVLAGPGLGKTTLSTRLAANYSADNYPVLKVSLRSVAASMRDGKPFWESVIAWGLDGAHIDRADLARARIRNFVLIADGLDECGDQQEAVAKGLAQLAVGNLNARIIVTSRPIGYDTALLSSWRHYEILPLGESAGSANLGKLIEAMPGFATSRDAYDEAKQQLGLCSNGDEIARSPQMIGIAAALIANGGTLGGPRAALYGRFFDLFEQNARSRNLPAVPNALRAKVIELLGWTLLKDPLSRPTDIVSECSILLGPLLGKPALAAASDVEAAMSYWEEVGLIERLRHGGTELLAFVHKSFAEYAAARHLLSMPDATRIGELARILNDKAWREVLRFAGEAGLGDEIAKLLLADTGRVNADIFTMLVTMLGNPETGISEENAQKLIELAFALIARGDDPDFTIGHAISSIAKPLSSIVGPAAAARTGSGDFSTKLVAWAAAVAAGPEWHDENRLKEIVVELRPRISLSAQSSLFGGGLRLGGLEDRALIQNIAIAALAVMQLDDALAFADEEFGHDAYGTTGFETRVKHTLVPKGAASDLRFSWSEQSDTQEYWRLFTPSDRDRAASLAAIKGLLEPVTDPATRHKAGGRLLEVSGLIAVSNFGEVSVYDSVTWLENYDRDAVAEVVRLLRDISVLDAPRLGGEAVTALSGADGTTGYGLGGFTPRVDIPAPDWTKVASAGPDRDLLIRAMRHGSVWVVNAATNLLSHLSPSKAEIGHLLDDVKGIGLAGAVHLLKEMQGDNAVAMLLNRLQGDLDEGTEYLLRELGRMDRAPEPELVAIVERGLQSELKDVVHAAARIAEKWAESGAHVDAAVLKKSATEAQKRDPSKDNVSYPGPRPLLVKLLLAQGAFDDDELIALLDDVRSDVRDPVRDEFVARAKVRPDLAVRLATEGSAKGSASHALRVLLRSKLALTKEQIIQLAARLTDAELSWRAAAVELLREPYIGASDIDHWSAIMGEDANSEIRAEALKRLDALRSGKEGKS